MPTFSYQMKIRVAMSRDRGRFEDWIKKMSDGAIKIRGTDIKIVVVLAVLVEKSQRVKMGEFERKRNGNRFLW